MSGGSSENRTTTTQNLTPEQQGLVNLAYPNAQAFAASNPTLPGAAGVAGFDPLQTQGQEAVVGSTGKMQGIVDTAGGTNQRIASGEFLDPGSNPVVQNAVKAATDPIYQDLRENVIPGQQATAASGSGVNYGGSREGIAEGRATIGAQRAAGQAGANIMNTALGQGLAATNQAISQAPATAAAEAIPGATTEAVGAQRQAQQQQVIDASNAANWFQQILPLLKAQQLVGLAAGTPGGSTTAVGQGTQDPGLASTLIGGASAAGGLAGGLGRLLPFI